MPSRQFNRRLSAFNAFLFLGAGIQLPFLPLWLSDRGFGTGEIALVMALVTAIRILTAPVGAFVADRSGSRRLVIIVCASGCFACYVAMGLVSGFAAVLTMAVLAAAFFAPVVPLTEVMTMEGSSLHGLDYGRIRLWASLSFLAGNLIAGALLEVIAVSSVIFLIAAAQGLEAAMALILPADAGHGTEIREPVRVGAIARVMWSGPFIVFLAAAGIGQATHGLFYAFGSVHWDQLGYGKLTIGELWAIGVIAEVVMFGFSNRVFALFGSTLLIATGVACGMVRWVLIGLEPPLAVLFAAQALHVGSFAMTHLGTMHYIREHVPAGMRNTVQGLYIALSGGILMSISMWAAGPLYGALGGAAYFVMAGFSALALVLAIILLRINPTGPAAAAT